ncbi:MAG: methylenetetrahydrofolate reductase [Gammaproteobacteria bacterium]|nr:methylenetetrahydrofolate reductase [Gammaproteobacteria bacterium]MDH5304877.1 methylenetetrahydrofolate reductase [Gammaproteobacteria bacterium]MDH5323034.1 methylenetetrahydrofolate reductase [Gammaproteobacteria bacterium]
MQTFQQALRSKDFVLTAELALDATAGRDAIIAQAEMLAAEVDAVQVPDSSPSYATFSPIAVSAILLQAGIDPILHLHCRDRNRLALRADVLGAAALGVSSLLLMRGQEVPEDARPKIKTVYDWGTLQLVRFVNSLEHTNFLTGSIATVFKPDRDWKPTRLEKKADAGTRFIQTQLCFDADLIRHYMACLVAEKFIQRASVIVALAPLPSADLAQWLGKNLRGAVVPAKVVKRLRQAANPEQEGIDICAELLREVAHIPGVSGTNLVCLGDAEPVAESVRRSGLRD